MNERGIDRTIARERDADCQESYPDPPMGPTARRLTASDERSHTPGLHREERAVNGTSTRRSVGRETRWLVETGATTAGNGPGSLRTERSPATVDPVGSGAERQRYRAAPIGGQPSVGHESGFAE